MTAKSLDASRGRGTNPLPNALQPDALTRSYEGPVVPFVNAIADRLVATPLDQNQIRALNALLSVVWQLNDTAVALGQEVARLKAEHEDWVTARARPTKIQTVERDRTGRIERIVTNEFQSEKES